MEYKAFTQHILELACETFDGKKVELREVLKNNGVRLTGLTVIDPTVSVSPTIYLEQFYERYQNGETPDAIMEQIAEIYEENRVKETVDFDVIYSYEKAKENLYYKVVNREKNESLLKEVPHRDFLDLALLPYIELDHSGFMNATTLVRSDMLSYWNITDETLLQDADENMKHCMAYTLTPIMEILKDHMNEETTEQLSQADPNMYVLLTPGMHFCAVLMAMEQIMEQVAQELDADLYVLPSSIHELIVIPATPLLCLSKLGELVKSVNESTVSSEDILSDHAYFYKRGSGYQSS